MKLNNVKYLSLPQQVEKNRKDVESLRAKLEASGLHLWRVGVSLESTYIVDKNDLIGIGITDVNVRDWVIGDDGYINQIVDKTENLLELTPEPVLVQGPQGPTGPQGPQGSLDEYVLLGMTSQNGNVNLGPINSYQMIFIAVRDFNGPSMRSDSQIFLLIEQITRDESLSVYGLHTFNGDTSQYEEFNLYLNESSGDLSATISSLVNLGWDPVIEFYGKVKL